MAPFLREVEVVLPGRDLGKEMPPFASNNLPRFWYCPESSKSLTRRYMSACT